MTLEATDDQTSPSMRLEIHYGTLLPVVAFRIQPSPPQTDSEQQFRRSSSNYDRYLLGVSSSRFFYEEYAWLQRENVSCDGSRISYRLQSALYDHKWTIIRPLTSAPEEGQARI
ncbi:hypothetical protein I7I51_06570 [Histoplasma capsulatum]|uniref:Uncharacterized protein n=1 Tax=Ajellomyces capsulatus TaxID=5037 RepID=A0A8A1MMA0_AJECA|nr:hypothetical protein I7I51_06570 [Histoplasma capsulatum]